MGSRSSSERAGQRLIALVLAGALAGCATVKPAERELLSDPAMTYGADGPSGGHEAHVLNNREGSFGAGEAAGGGCGCN